MLQLGRMLNNAFQGNDMVLTLPPASESGLMGIIRVPILSGLKWVGVQVEHSVQGVHIGSYDPDTGVTLLEYFFGTLEGFLLMAVTLALSYVLFHLSMLSIRPAIESYRIHAEERLQRNHLTFTAHAIWQFGHPMMKPSMVCVQRWHSAFHSSAKCFRRKECFSRTRWVYFLARITGFSHLFSIAGCNRPLIGLFATS